MNTLDLLQLTQEQKIKGVWMSGIKGEGELRQWRENGQLYAKAFCKNNEFHGKYLQWHNNGQLYAKVYFKNGQLHGKYLQWNSNGKLNIKAFYKNGKEISCEYFRST